MISEGVTDMAHYTVTHTCGHEERVNLIGKYTERERRLEQMSRQACTECYREAQRQVAQEQADKMQLPVLTGTEKQVAWALKLRGDVIDEIERLLRVGPEDGAAKARRALSKALQELTKASWWIDHRFEGRRALDPYFQAALKADD